MVVKKNYSQLSVPQIDQYKRIVRASFPDIIFESEVVKHGWDKIEKYFPEYQIFYVDENDDMIGFINAVPFYWNQPLEELPDEGWDWLVEQSIKGYEEGIKPNCIGGLQIIVAKDHLGKGYSKSLIKEGKKVQEALGFKNFLIPIRPTFKSKYPQMEMTEYMQLKSKGKIYDPWIRTHMSSGAEIIKICPNAMHIYGDLPIWERLLNQKITTSGQYIVEGALNPVDINVKENYGEYREDNIWINYS